MGKAMILPSLMCADMCLLKETLEVFEKEKTDYLHIDIMDGEFVPNFALGTDYINKLRQLTSIHLDIHLMINEPERKLDYFTLKPGDIVSVHTESTKHIVKTAEAIKKAGCMFFPAINPGTPLNAVEELTGYMDGLLIMTVNPGFAGQKMVPNSLSKIEKARRMLNELGYENLPIEVDGNVSFANAEIMREAGADIFVAGSSSVFSTPDLTENIRRMRNIIK